MKQKVHSLKESGYKNPSKLKSSKQKNPLVRELLPDTAAPKEGPEKDKSTC